MDHAAAWSRGSSSIWYKQAGTCKRQYNLILPDFFGHGLTRKTLPAYTFEGLADEMAEVLDDLGLTGCIFWEFPWARDWDALWAFIMGTGSDP
jgi:pimeloyl-ACP methyl ester carboxylesterase